MIFVYRATDGWGSVARSRDPGLHGRKPLFATPRALALSYVEGYVDFTGRVKAYAVVDLRVLGALRLATCRWQRLEGGAPAARLAAPAASARPTRAPTAMRRRYVAFREAHGYKPWRYYKGRERWTPLPPEFRHRG